MSNWRLSPSNPKHPGYNNYQIVIAMHEMRLQYDYREKLIATIEVCLIKSKEVELFEKLSQNADRIDHLYISNGLIVDDYLRVYGRIEMHIRPGCKAHDRYPYYG